MIRTFIVRSSIAGFAIPLAAAVAGCGDRSFSVEEFVSEMNDRGAGIELGQELITTSEDTDVVGFTLESGGQGTIRAGADTEAAEDAFASCEAAGEFTCYRAANVVVIVDGLPGGSPTIEQAIKGIASD